MSGSALVTIATPVYNGAQFLDECITSVIAQTYPHWEHIILDNCSTDATVEIARRYAEQDPRIRVIAPDTFVPQLPNFNRLLRLMSPESRYCKFVLADDWIFPNCLEQMIRVAEAGDNVGLVGSYSICGDEVGHRGLPYSRNPIFEGRDACRRYMLSYSGFLGSPTGVMYRSDLVRARDPFFDERSTMGADIRVCLQLMQEAQFGFCFQVLTFNRRGNDGIWERDEPFGPSLLVWMILVHEFGPGVLSPSEYRERLEQVEGDYYLLLAEGLVRRYGDKFWDFHRGHLKAVGLEIDSQKLGWATAKYLADRIGNPKRTIANALRRGSL